MAVKFSLLLPLLLFFSVISAQTNEDPTTRTMEEFSGYPSEPHSCISDSLSLSVDKDSLQKQIDELSTFSDTPAPSVTRILYSDKDVIGRRYIKNIMGLSGLSIREDAVGNIFGRWEGSEAELPPVATGSHVDAIPYSGKYDGVVGVLGALEAINALKRSGFKPKRSLEVIMFTSEEPTRFGISCLGSRLMAGSEPLVRALKETVDGQNISFFDAASSAGYSKDQEDLSSVFMKKGSYSAFVELHIEQGPILEDEGVSIGIVTAIAAPASIKPLITMTVFFRTRMHHETLEDGGIYLGALYFAIIMILFNGFTEVAMLISKLSVLYKHRDLHFYPCWIYTLPSWLLSIPTSLVESSLWVVVTYYVIGFDPQITRFLRQLLLFFFLHQMSLPLFRLMASLGRNMIVANTFGSFAMLVVLALGGYIISKDSIPSWWIWGFWFSPLMYAQNAASVNEFLGHSWDKKTPLSNVSLGKEVLLSRDFFTQAYWYWIGVGALLGYTIIFNFLLIISLTYLNPLGKPQAVVSKEELQERDQKRKGETLSVDTRSYVHSNSVTGMNGKEQRGMVLPFQPLSMCFRNMNYYVDVPVELKQQGILEERLQLLVNVTGAFRPGVLTALVGVSGAGKTTLMDVLAGRKTGGHIEGSITISGYPKSQETFARVSGYCEQTDIHSPCLTVLESLLYSAWLRLPSHVDLEIQRAFVDEVMELVELTPLSGALVGIPGIDGLSTEQRKRLTIAVELVANPSIVFMDEPTSGLDARSAAIVMRTVRNIVDTGRTIVCTIHQPSIDIFESFDELLFMKRGGELIYAGPLGSNSCKLVEFFEAVEGVPKIKAGYNPAAWMLDVTSPAQEGRLGVDFAEVYRRSNLFQQNMELVETLSKPNYDSKELNFSTKYSQPFIVQFLACLWKQNLSYWRNPQYTAVRFFYTVVISLIFGSICWRFGSKRESQQDLMNAMGAMYSAVLFIGITNATAVQPVVSIERFVSYRERAAGMYSALPFAFAQVAIEFPYVFVQTVIYGSVFYSMGSFEWDLEKFVWYIFFMYFTLLYFTFFGMMTTAVTPNHNVAPIIAAPFYMLWNLFCGFMITHKRLPGWWRWYYWANPIAWSLYGLLTSQYGDLDEPMKLWDGVHSVSIKNFLRDYFEYRHDFLGIAGIMVVSFCVLFAFIYAFAIKSFNFQRR